MPCYSRHGDVPWENKFLVVITSSTIMTLVYAIISHAMCVMVTCLCVPHDPQCVAQGGLQVVWVPRCVFITCLPAHPPPPATCPSPNMVPYACLPATIIPAFYSITCDRYCLVPANR